MKKLSKMQIADLVMKISENNKSELYNVVDGTEYNGYEISGDITKNDIDLSFHVNENEVSIESTPYMAVGGYWIKSGAKDFNISDIESKITQYMDYFNNEAVA
tara:strand:+ start:158 stop:466 length:309 start_codon:yes stop_codon:yes gene_type:complete